MRFRKIFIFCLMLVVMASSLNAVASSGTLDLLNITPFDDDTVVEIDEFNFTIPAGFGEEEITRVNDTNHHDITALQFNYFNDDGKLVGITILYNGSDITVDDFDTTAHTKKTIAGKDGMFKQDSDGSVDFFFIENNKYISLMAPNETTVQKMIEG